ncbi:MAG: hypothetical protein O6952_04020 [Planctomycetota bacterium]|nr:hypothetical protein [Planctomycetota bacterium]
MRHRASSSRAKPEVLTRGYEDLRRDVIEGGGWNPGHGRAVLERKGLVAWMEAWSQCTRPPGASVLRESSDGGRLGKESFAGVVEVLANMALSCLEVRSA